MTIDTARPSVRVERTVRASADAVFDAWTDVEQLKRWWGPRGITATAAELDVRPGGAYSITMQPDKGASFVLAGEYRAVERPSRIQMTWAYSGEAVKDSVESIVTVVLEAQGSATRMVLTQEFLKERDDMELVGEAATGFTATGCKASPLAVANSGPRNVNVRVSRPTN